MEAEAWPTAIDLKLQSLLADSKRYNFYQLNQLIQKFIGHDDNQLPTHVRYASKKSLSFPSADIDQANFYETPLGKEIQVVVTFMGLFGPSSPLPAFYTERLLHSDDEAETMRQFLDLVNHHMISMLQDTWEKYRYYIQFKNQATDRISDWLFSMVGLPSVESLQQKKLDWSKLLPLASFFAMRVKNSEGLSGVLRGYFDGVEFEVEEHVQRTVSIPLDQGHQMGVDNCSMGINAMLGDEVEDRMGKIRVHVRGLDQDAFEGFLPGNENNQILRNLIELYLRDQFDYELCLHTQIDSFYSASMDGESAYLGWNTCMGEPTFSEQSVII